MLFTALAVIFALFRAKSATVISTLTGALVFALWFNWSHWVDLSHHWTQRDQFWRYYTQRKPGRAHRGLPDELARRDVLLAQQVKQIKDNPQRGHVPVRRSSPAASGRWSSTTAWAS